MAAPNRHDDRHGDEVRRQVRDIDQAHRSALGTFRAALDRAFDPSSRTDPASKAALVGLPDRRGFLKIGGLTIAASAFMVACSNDGSSSSKPSGPGGGGTTGTVAAGGPAEAATTDATLVLTAESIEQLAIATYQKAIDSGLLKTAAVLDVARYFQAQHRDHAGLLAATATKMGQKVTGQPNPYLQQTFVDPALEVLKDEAGVLELAVGLEKAAAESYTFAGGVFSVAPLRQAIMTIGGIEARHLAVLYHVQGTSPVPVPFMKTDEAVPKDSLINPTGTVTPYPPTTTTTTTTAVVGPLGTTTGSTK